MVFDLKTFHRFRPAAREPERLIQRRWLKWIIVFGFWTLCGFLYASTIYFETRLAGMSHSWWRMLAWQLLNWYGWGGLTPLILWLGRRFSIERSSWKRGLLAHLLVATIVSIIHTALATSITILIRPFDSMGSTAPFGRQFLKRVPGSFTFDFFIYGAIIGFVYAVDYYYKYREHEFRAAQLETQLAQAQLQALKMQLHPHFLFNTLNAIAGLVRDNDNKAAIGMLVGLSDLLRHVLENSGKQEVSLREELDFLELYLDIQQMRFSDRLRIKMEIAPETLEARVPNLILQPLVENAIRHGIARRIASGLIGVRARSESGLLQITVYDDGPGLQEGWHMESKKGIGLANVRARLQQLYGTEYRFDIRNRVEGGAEAVLSIPLRLRTEEGESHG